jgi:multiple sugar transport system substrate-binding protein
MDAMTRLFGAVVCGALLVILGGCLPRGVEVVRAASPVAEERTVSVAHWSESAQFARVLDGIGRSCGGITIRPLFISRDRYYIELSSLMLENRGPDVLMLPEENVEAYVRNGWLIPLSSLRERGPAGSPSLPVEPSAPPLRALEAYYEPHAIETSRLLWNRGVFRLSGLDPDTPPATIAELEAYAGRIGERAENLTSAFAFPLGEGIETFREVFESSAFRSGRSHFRADPIAYDLGIYEPWLRLLHGLDMGNLMLPGWKTLTKRGALENFLRGNVAMLVAGSADYAYLAANRPRSLDIGVGPVPALTARALPGSARSGYGFVVNAESRSVSDSLRVWECLYSAGTRDALLGAGVAIPASAGAWRGKDAPRVRTFSFEAFLPFAGESLRYSPQNLCDSAVLFEAYRAALDTHPDRIPQILESAAAACTRRAVLWWNTYGL